jgi:hypothetical protein
MLKALIIYLLYLCFKSTFNLHCAHNILTLKVMLCSRKVFIPLGMEWPLENVPWNIELFLWVGPDGYPIPMNIWEGLCQQRDFLRRYMERPKHAPPMFLKHCKELSIPGLLPVLEIDPPAIESEICPPKLL